MNPKIEKKSKFLENKIFWQIYSLTLKEEGVWGRKHNREIKELVGEPDKVRVIRGTVVH